MRGAHAGQTCGQWSEAGDSTSTPTSTRTTRHSKVRENCVLQSTNLTVHGIALLAFVTLKPIPNKSTIRASSPNLLGQHFEAEQSSAWTTWTPLAGSNKIVWQRCSTCCGWMTRPSHPLLKGNLPFSAPQNSSYHNLPVRNCLPGSIKSGQA